MRKSIKTITGLLILSNILLFGCSNTGTSSHNHSKVSTVDNSENKLDYKKLSKKYKVLYTSNVDKNSFLDIVLDKKLNTLEVGSSKEAVKEKLSDIKSYRETYIANKLTGITYEITRNQSSATLQLLFDDKEHYQGVFYVYNTLNKEREVQKFFNKMGINLDDKKYTSTKIGGSSVKATQQKIRIKSGDRMHTFTVTDFKEKSKNVSSRYNVTELVEKIKKIKKGE